MNRILIIEDDKNQREYLVNKAKEIDQSYIVDETESYQTGLEMAMKNTYKVFFIDVEIIGGSGIDLAKTLREVKKYQFTPMVFITGMINEELEAYRHIQCYKFIKKPYGEEEITGVMKTLLIDYLNQNKNKNKYFDMEFKGVKQRVNIDDILFMESRNRRVVIRTKYEEINYKYISLKKCMEKLNDDMVQVHQAYLINLKYVKRMDIANQFIELTGYRGLIPIGSTYKKSVGGLIS